MEKDNSRVSKSISGVTVDLSSIKFKKKLDDFYIYGYVLYKRWDTCFSDKYRYALLCLYSIFQLTVDNYKYYGSDWGTDIVCEGNKIPEEKINDYNYFGCAIMEKTTNNYIVSNQIRIEGYEPPESEPTIVLDDVERKVDRNESRSQILGTVHYKNFASCSNSYRLRCYGSYDKVTEYEISNWHGLSVDVNCGGNEIGYYFTGKERKVYFGCGIYKNGEMITYKIKKMAIKIDILFLYKMFGYTLIGNIVGICVVIVCALR